MSRTAASQQGWCPGREFGRKTYPCLIVDVTVDEESRLRVSTRHIGRRTVGVADAIPERRTAGVRAGARGKREGRWEAMAGSRCGRGSAPRPTSDRTMVGHPASGSHCDRYVEPPLSPRRHSGHHGTRVPEQHHPAPTRQIPYDPAARRTSEHPPDGRRPNPRGGPGGQTPPSATPRHVPEPASAMVLLRWRTACRPFVTARSSTVTERNERSCARSSEGDGGTDQHCCPRH